MHVQAVALTFICYATFYPFCYFMADVVPHGRWREDDLTNITLLNLKISVRYYMKYFTETSLNITSYCFTWQANATQLAS